jgi:hypothetical protein
MGLKKGSTNNPNGRPKGSQNKINENLREVLTNIVYENVQSLKDDLKLLSPKDRVSLMLKIVDITLPKIRSIDNESLFSFKEYEEYLKMKAEKEKLELMSEEEIQQELNRLRKLVI